MSDVTKVLDSIKAAMKDENDQDVDFARMMIGHSLMTVAMSDMQSRMGKSPSMVKLSKTMMDDHKKKIKEMRDWLEERGHPEMAEGGGKM